MKRVVHCCGWDLAIVSHLNFRSIREFDPVDTAGRHQKGSAKLSTNTLLRNIHDGVLRKCTTSGSWANLFGPWTNRKFVALQERSELWRDFGELGNATDPYPSLTRCARMLSPPLDVQSLSWVRIAEYKDRRYCSRSAWYWRWGL